MSAATPGEPGRARRGADADRAAAANRLRETRRAPQGTVRHGPGAGLGMPVQKPLNFMVSARRLLGLLRPARAHLAAAVVLTLLGITLSTLGPAVLGRATDLIFAAAVGKNLPAGASKEQAVSELRANGQATYADMVSAMEVVPGQGMPFDRLARILGLVVALYVVSAFLAGLAARVITFAAQTTVRRVRGDVEDKIHRLPLSYFDTQPRGELISRVTNDIDNLGQSLQLTLNQLLNSLVSVVAILGMMLWVSPLLTLIALVAIPLSVVVTAAIARRSQPRFIQQWAHTGELNAQIEEAFTGHEIVTVFGRRHEVTEAMSRTNARLFEATFGAQFASSLIMPVMFFVGNLSYALVALAGCLRVAHGQMTLGGIQAFIQYSRQFTQPLTQVASMANLIQSGVASAERVFECLDAPEQVPDPADGPAIEGARGRIEFEHVFFSYRPDAPLIEDLSFVAEPGHTVAIVGPTGAGKTTLVNLIMRFYEIDSGRITLDGRDITELSRHELRDEIGMVLQDTWLFRGTIRENIAYGHPRASGAEILEAATATYVDRFVAHLPAGYDTVVDDEGAAISAGEKQLVTIARAFLANPSLLILDEATSAVDTRTELRLQRAMAALRSDRTSFVIAHRLSTIREADLILVMEHGRIVERGTHASLLAARGAYSRLYHAQFRGPTVTDEEIAKAPVVRV